jgi:uncharacterized membrane protein YgdD (TMEM256/DUF423 family)
MLVNILVMLAAIAVLVLAPLSREKNVRTATQGLAGLVFAVGLVFFMARLFRPVV